MRASPLTIQIAILIFLVVGCQTENPVMPARYTYIKPRYDQVKMITTYDTISFPLDDKSYNAIKSFNVFSNRGKEFISFYDERSKHVMIYDFETRVLEKKINLKKILSESSLYKTTAYTRNFDTIFLANYKKLYLADSSCKIKKSIEYIDGPSNIWAQFENTNQPALINGQFYASVRPYVDPASISALEKWKVLYQFDLEKKQRTLSYHLPEIYRKNLYGYHFLDYSYCYNNRGNFVFSFPADPNVYETNLSDLNHSYLAKSQHQAAEITPATKEIIKDQDKTYKYYMTKDSYGAIYFDPAHQRYLRVAKSKITEKDFEAKNRNRKNSFVIFNDQLAIIGEAPIPDGISYKEIFFTRMGKMYARINTSNEYAIQFVQLKYNDSTYQATPLAKQ